MPSSLKRNEQAQDDIILRIPLWVWILSGLALAAIGVIWTLYEERKKEQRSTLLSEPPAARGGAPLTIPAEDVTMPISQPAVITPAGGAKTTAPAKPDNLKQIVGIGPKIMQVLNDHGIFTFEQLANTEIAFLKALVEAQGWHMADPTSWPEQARLLAEQRRAEL
jgi:predicted flap endonuclease-1-like 5' DNA nuclease